MKKIDLEQKIGTLEPQVETIESYKELEASSIIKIKEFFTNGDPKFAKFSTQVLSSINRLRSILNTQMNIRIRAFKDISKDKKELRMYIKATYPHLTKK